jgi:hypothetical protein
VLMKMMMMMYPGIVLIELGMIKTLKG